MKLTEQISATPIQAEKTLRTDELRAITSAKAGKIIPTAYVPILREDRVSRGRTRIRFEMAETAETLLNAVNVTAYAHFVPFLAFERFDGSLDRLNRSYRGEPDKEGGDVIPFFEDKPSGANDEIARVMGMHVPASGRINSAVHEAYNCLVNYRYRARSTKLPQRGKLDSHLAPCFWKNSQFNHIVPDFDQAMIDGEVELNLSGSIPIQGIGVQTPQDPYGSTTVRSHYSDSDGKLGVRDDTYEYQHGSDAFTIETNQYGIPKLIAELEQSGIQLSLSNIEMAKKTAAFAKLRKQFAGLDDDYIIDLLMEAVRVPDAQMAQPMLLDRKSTMFGWSKRYATNSDGLDKHVTTGETFIDLTYRTPPMNTGGIIIITCEIVPEQMFERQEDHFLTTTKVDQLPSFTRDYLDPEKVSVVNNRHVDVKHSDPDGTFGYAPLNHEWKRNIPRIGGKFMRPDDDAFTEARQRIWSVEQVDPALTEDFYLAKNLHHDVFADTASDPFEITTLGAAQIVGNTVFGKGLEEDTNDYAELRDQVDSDRIDQDE